MAYEGQSESLDERDPNRKRFSQLARQHAETVAAHAGEFQRPASRLLAALDTKKDAKEKARPARGKSSKDKDKDKENADGNAAFLEHFERGKQALEAMQDAAAQLKAIAPGADSAAFKALEKQRDDNTALARQALEQALNVSTRKTPVEDLNEARYYLSFLAYDGGRLYDAAVLGEFLADRYPDSPRGPQGARIALAAYVTLYGEAKSDDKSFERAQIERIAETIFKRWPGQEEADQAALTLLNFAAAQNQLGKALEYLAKISPNSPRRGPAELRAGQLLWAAYARLASAHGRASGPGQDGRDEKAVARADQAGHRAARDRARNRRLAAGGGIYHGPNQRRNGSGRQSHRVARARQVRPATAGQGGQPRRGPRRLRRRNLQAGAKGLYRGAAAAAQKGRERDGRARKTDEGRRPESGRATDRHLHQLGQPSETALARVAG